MGGCFFYRRVTYPFCTSGFGDTLMCWICSAEETEETILAYSGWLSGSRDVFCAFTSLFWDPGVAGMVWPSSYQGTHKFKNRNVRCPALVRCSAWGLRR